MRPEHKTTKKTGRTFAPAKRWALNSHRRSVPFAETESLWMTRRSSSYNAATAFRSTRGWIGGSPRYANIPMPKVATNAVPDARDPTAIHVSWSSPGGGNVFLVYVVGPDGTFTSWTGKVPAGSAVFHGKPGKSYWFWASVTTDLGWKDANGSQVVKLDSVHSTAQ